jgi:hypothetical protein
VNKLPPFGPIECPYCGFSPLPGTNLGDADDAEYESRLEVALANGCPRCNRPLPHTLEVLSNRRKHRAHYLRERHNTMSYSLRSDSVNIIHNTTEDFPQARECGIVIITPSKYHTGKWEIVVSDITGPGNAGGFAIGWCYHSEHSGMVEAMRIALERFFLAPKKEG